MLIKTHLAITFFLVLILLPLVNNKIIFLVVALLATYMPDIDSKNSKLGHHWFFRPLQWFADHRGMIHSFTFLFILTLILVLFFPILALPFFLGYSSHLIADSFTLEGIKPFHPFGKRSSWKVRTGGETEITVLFVFVIVDLILVLGKVSSIF
jgi:inner membrane protein